VQQVRATQQVNAASVSRRRVTVTVTNGNFGGARTPLTPEPIDYKFDTRYYVGELTLYAKFHQKSAAHGLAGNMVKCTPRVLFKNIFLQEIFSESSTEKNTQQFQALNGLKCSTVGNLGS